MILRRPLPAIAARSLGPLALAVCLAGLHTGPAGATAPLTLEQAVRRALERHERALRSDQELAAAEARVARARAFFLPGLTLRGDYTRRAYETTRTVDGERVTIQSRNALRGTATVDQPVLNLRAIPAYQQASRRRDAARYAALDARRLLAFDTAAAYLAALNAGQVREAASRRRELAERSALDARARSGAGLTTSNDATRAELELALAEREEARASGGARSSLLELGFLTGGGDAVSLVSPDSLFAASALPTGGPDSLLLLAGALRPDLLRARREASAARAAVREAAYRILPEVAFTGEYEMTNEGGLGGRDTDWSLGLGAAWQPWDGGDRRADMRERRAVALAADLAASEEERRVALEVRRAIVTLESEQASLEDASAAADAARRNAAEAAELYRQGLVSAFESLDANVRLFEAEVDLARTRFGLGLAFLDLRAALGLDPLGREFAP